MANLHIGGLFKVFGAHAVLRGLDLELASGRLLAVLGPSGSGKTTLLRLICGFDAADGGTIAIDAERVAGPGLHVPSERRRIGYVAQEGALFPHLSVAENIVFGLPRAARRRRDRVPEFLHLVGLSANFAERSPQSLSGGEQQRVALARALAPSPKLVLLDEPFSALDAAARAETRAAICSALSRAGATALLVTHDQAEALSVGHQVAVLQHGRLIQVADPKTLYRRPVDMHVAQFVGDAIVVPAHLCRGRVTSAIGTWCVPATVPDGPVDMVIRPEQVRLTSGPGGHGLRGRVTNVTFYGHDARIDLQLLAEGTCTCLSARAAGHQLPETGEEADVTIEGDVLVYSAHAMSIARPARRSPPDSNGDREAP